MKAPPLELSATGSRGGAPARPGAPPGRQSAEPAFAIGLGDEDRPAAGSLLAEIRYAPGAGRGAASCHPVVELDLPQLAGPPAAEYWTTHLPVTSLEVTGMRLAMDGEVLFGYLATNEAPEEPFDALLYRGYCRILGESRAFGYPHLLRVWNYFPAINRTDAELERYQQFCLGRHRAFVELEADFQRHLPAATAIGTRSGPVQLYFLAGKTDGLPIENPRQVSAYHYPPRYGPCSPSFSRATLYGSGSGQRLFIAGTSSIVGHASRHLGDPYRQAVETLRNIETVIATARSLRDTVGRSIGLPQRASEALVKVYVRRPEDLSIVQTAFDEHLKLPARCLYLNGDICRSNLLVEAEAVIA